MTRGKILVIRGGAIGDFVLTLPAISALRRHFPDAHLEVLGYPHIVQLAVAGGLVNRAERIEAPSLAGFFARSGALAQDMMDYFSEFDIIVSYLYDPDGIFKTNIGRCSPAQFIVGPHRPDERQGIHASQTFLRPLERLAIFEADPVPWLPLEPHRIAPNQIALHPGSGSDQKNWQEEKWSRLLEHLVCNTRFNLLLVGGEAEGERLQRLAAALPPSRSRVAQSLPLIEVARLLAGSVCFIGHDSGISHIAAAVGLPGLLLWGPSAERVWRPPSDRMRMIRGLDGLHSLDPQVVINELESLLRSLSIG